MTKTITENIFTVSAASLKSMAEFDKISCMHAKAILPWEMYAKKGKKSRMHLLHFENSWISRDLWCLGKSNNSCLVGPQVTVCRATLQRLAVNMKKAALDQIRGIPLTRPSMWDPPLPMFQ